MVYSFRYSINFVKGDWMRKEQRKSKGRAGLSARAYQALLDRRKLWDLVCMQTPQVQIAQIMGKDPAWVSRTIQEIQADFATVHATPNESGIIRENIARWESLFAEALRNLYNSAGFPRISALRAAAEIHRHKAEYEVTVGWVANRRYGEEAHRGPTIAELRDEISEEDLKAVFLTVADNIREQEAKEAKEIPALPDAATAGQN